MRRWVWPWGLLALLGLVACSGSGSSGFDGPHANTLHPARLAENALIAEVIDDGECIPVEMLQVCPTNTRLTPTGGEVATPLSPTPPQPVCTPLPSRAVCQVPVTFLLQDFAPTGSFWIAARPLHSNAPWHLSDPVLVRGSASAPRLEAIVEVPAAATDNTPTDMLVVLLMVADPARTVPAQFDQLEDSGADLAVVTQLFVPH